MTPEVALLQWCTCPDPHRPALGSILVRPSLAG